MQAELDRGADLAATGPYPYGLTPLHWATFHGNPEIVKLLLEHGADATAKSDDGVPVMHSAGGKDGEVIRLLLEYGADIGAVNGEGRAPCQLADDDDDRVRALLCP